jgi:hypothetical protein
MVGSLSEIYSSANSIFCDPTVSGVPVWTAIVSGNVEISNGALNIAGRIEACEQQHPVAIGARGVPFICR